uniref:Uncharacterized protein n=1 Tax=Rhizophora mucronata TaxID=61149 RepID=A0A2P2P2I7_RHIMU
MNLILGGKLLPWKESGNSYMRITKKVLFWCHE